MHQNQIQPKRSFLNQDRMQTVQKCFSNGQEYRGSSLRVSYVMSIHHWCVSTLISKFKEILHVHNLLDVYVYNLMNSYILGISSNRMHQNQI